MQQKFDVSGKSVVTINPGAFMNFYFTSGTGSMKISKNLSYIFGPGEWGISRKVESKDDRFDYTHHKHSIHLSIVELAINGKRKDVRYAFNDSEKNYQIKILYFIM